MQFENMYESASQVLKMLCHGDKLTCRCVMVFLYSVVLLQRSAGPHLTDNFLSLKVHIGYLPNKQVLGLSKLAR